MVRYTTLENLPPKRLPIYGPAIPVRPTFEAWWKHYMHLKKITDYMYRIWIPKADYNRAIEHVTESSIPAGCSSFKVGNYHARNLDYFHDEKAYFLTYIPKSPDTTHASLAVCGYIDALTKEFVESGEWSEAYVYMPCFVSDGINDAGIVINTNVVPAIDNPLDPTKENHITGTAPGKMRMPTALVARYILDHANSIDEALELFYTIDIYTPTGILTGYEYHWMLSDRRRSVVVEIVNNTIYCYDTNILTNFYITGYNGDMSNICLAEIKEAGIPRNSTVTKHACGLERYKYIYTQLAADSSLSRIMYIAKSIRYSNAYKKTTSPFWYSEYFGNYGGTTGDLTIDSELDMFDEVIAADIAEYQKDRRNGKTWRTVHTSIYNLEELRIMLQVQEQDEMYTFDLREFMKIDVDKLGDMTKWIDASVAKPLPSPRCPCPPYPPPPCPPCPPYPPCPPPCPPYPPPPPFPPPPPPRVYVEWDDVLNKPDTFTPSPHKHSASDIEGLQSVTSFQMMRPPYEYTIWLVIDIYSDAEMTKKLYTIDGRTANGAAFMKIDSGTGFVAVTKDGLDSSKEGKLLTIDLSSLTLSSKVYIRWSWYAIDGDVVATSNFTYPSVTPFDPISMGLVWQGN